MQAAALDDFIHALAERISREALELASESEIFPNTHVRVEGNGFGQISDAAAGLEGLEGDVSFERPAAALAAPAVPAAVRTAPPAKGCAAPVAAPVVPPAPTPFLAVGFS